MRKQPKSRTIHTPLRRRTTVGVVWSGIGQFGSQAIHYVVLLVLAWLLSPADFGLLGVAMIFILFTQAVGELGLAAAVVQQREITEIALSTVFWANLVVSLLMTAITYVSAEAITSFLGDISVAPLLRVLSVIFPITALAVVPRALLEKELKFQQLTMREFAGEIAFGLVGLTMAFVGAGVWSLVGAAVAQRLASTAMLWVAVPWRPKLEFDWPSLRGLLRFGLYTMLAALLNRGLVNVDYFVVGRWWGVEALGYYTLAFQLAVAPAQRLIGVLHKVMFPVLSSIQDDLTRLRTGFLESFRHFFVIVVPISLFLAMLAPWFIEAVYGAKWLLSVQPLQILALAGFFRGFDAAEAVYFAVGRPQIRVWIVGIRLALFAIFAAVFGVAGGIVGVAISLTLSLAITSFIGFGVVSRITHTSWRELMQPVWFAVRAALLACTLPTIFRFSPVEMASPWVVLVGLGIAMALTYGLVVMPMYRGLLSRMFTWLFSTLPKR